jgi:DNA-3-methyladenine glycosylase
MVSRLARPFYARDTAEVARDLLGKVVVRRRADGGLEEARIVETEAYHGPHDRASHASRGPTPRNAPMFGPPGVAYVYQIYGMYFCLNTVTMDEGFPAAVLLRAAALDAPRTTREGAGPGKLCRALGIDKRHTGLDLVTSDELWVGDDGLAVERRQVRTGPRVNIDYAGPRACRRHWRFWVDAHPAVSRLPRRPAAPRDRA